MTSAPQAACKKTMMRVLFKWIVGAHPAVAIACVLLANSSHTSHVLCCSKNEHVTVNFGQLPFRFDVEVSCMGHS
jgi:hypothetical protein